MSREVYQVFPAPTLQLIRRHLSLSGAPLPLLSLRLRFSFSLMRFWNLSQAVCCLSACHRSFAHRQIWGVCVFCEAADYSRPHDWCSLFNMFTCKTRFVGAAAAATVVCYCPPPPSLKFSCDCWIKYWKLRLFQSSKYREEAFKPRQKFLLKFLFLELSVVGFGRLFAGPLLIQSEVASDLRSQAGTLLRCHISPTLLFITRE